MHACRNSQHPAELVQWYIDHGAQVNSKKLVKHIPLFAYIKSSRSNSPGHQKIKILLQEGALLRAYSNNVLHIMNEQEKR